MKRYTGRQNSVYCGQINVHVHRNTSVDPSSRYVLVTAAPVTVCSGLFRVSCHRPSVRDGLGSVACLGACVAVRAIHPSRGELPHVHNSHDSVPHATGVLLYAHTDAPRTHSHTYTHARTHVHGRPSYPKQTRPFAAYTRHAARERSACGRRSCVESMCYRGSQSGRRPWRWRTRSVFDLRTVDHRDQEASYQESGRTLRRRRQANVTWSTHHSPLSLHVTPRHSHAHLAPSRHSIKEAQRTRVHVGYIHVDFYPSQSESSVTHTPVSWSQSMRRYDCRSTHHQGPTRVCVSVCVWTQHSDIHIDCHSCHDEQQRLTRHKQTHAHL